MRLLEPIELKGRVLRNRVAMAPLTRSRSSERGVQGPLAPLYYRQRASAGLIISEATCISEIGRGYPRVPGIWNQEQIEAWKPVTQAVHEEGGTIICQLWHTGRHGLSSLMPGGPVSASDVRLDRMITGYDMERHPADTPRPLTLDEIQSTVEDYSQGTRNALEAGFDGVQIHGANGYLIDQFLRDGTNLRTDHYGGSALKRVRFLVEVTEAVVEAAGDAITSLRLSPSNTDYAHDTDYLETFLTAARELRGRGIDLLEIREGDHTEGRCLSRVLASFAQIPLCVNQGYTPETAERAISEARADMVAFGVPYISNPDLVERIRDGVPLAEADPGTFYYGDGKGYTDYPTATRASA